MARNNTNNQNPNGPAASATGAMRAGIRAVVNDAEAAQGAMLSMGLALATGAGKAEAALAGLREFMVGRLLGPLANLGSVAIGVSASMLRMGRSFAEAGRQGAAGIEKLERSFRVLVGGAEAAKRRVADLVRFAKETPFSMAGVVEANRTLQVLTKGMLAGKDGMKLVGDAAAVAGVSLEQVALQVGRLYDGLQNGTPVGEAAFRLQELGLLSGAARAQISALQETGADGNAVWAVAAADLGRYAGGMKEVSKSLDAMQRQLEDVQDQAQTKFATGYMDGMKAGVEAQTKAIEGMLPVLQYMGEWLGAISGKWDQFKASVMNATVGSEAFKAAAIPAFQALTVLVSGITTATGAMALMRAASIAAAVAQGAFARANRSAAASSVQAAAAARAQAVATAGGGLAGQVAGLKAWHAAIVQAASAGGVFQARQYAMTVASGVLRGALMAVRNGVVALGRAFLALGPVGWAMVALGALAVALSHLRKAMVDSAERTRAFAAAQKEAVSALQREAAAARTAADAQKVRSRALMEMVDVMEQIRQKEAELAQKQADGNQWERAKKAAAEYGVDLKNLAAGMPGLWKMGWDALKNAGPKAQAHLEDWWNGGTRETQAELDALRVRKDATGAVLARNKEMLPVYDMAETQGAAGVAEALSPALTADVGQLEALLESKRVGGAGDVERKRVEGILAENAAGIKDAQNRGAFDEAEALRARSRAVQTGSSDRETQLRGQMAGVDAIRVAQTEVQNLEAQLAELQAQGTQEDGDAEKARQAELVKTTKALEAQMGALEAMGQITPQMAADYNAAAVELERLNKLTAEQVAQQLRAARIADEQATAGAAMARADLLDDEIARLEQVQSLQRELDRGAVGRGEMSQTQFEGAEATRQAEMEKARRARERGLEDAGLGRRESLAGLKDESLEKELAMLDIEEERVRLALERQTITAEEAAMQMDVLEAQRARAEELAGRRREAAVAAVQEARLMREARGARRRGDFAGGDRLENQANALGDAQFKKEEELRLRAVGFDAETAALMAQEAVLDRIAEREERRGEAVEKTRQELVKQEAALKGNLGVLQQIVTQQQIEEKIARGLTAQQAQQATAREQKLKAEEGQEQLQVKSLRAVAARLRASGDTKGAEKYDKRADKIDEKNRSAELVGEGMDKETAKRIAKGERQLAEAGRKEDPPEMKVGGRVAVSSLVRVGGGVGPNVSGLIDLTRKGNDLLSKIEANTRAPSEKKGFGAASLVDY